MLCSEVVCACAAWKTCVSNSVVAAATVDGAPGVCVVLVSCEASGKVDGGVGLLFEDGPVVGAGAGEVLEPTLAVMGSTPTEDPACDRLETGLAWVMGVAVAENVPVRCSVVVRRAAAGPTVDAGSSLLVKLQAVKRQEWVMLPIEAGASSEESCRDPK